jgi:hypothetical protein
MATTRDLAARKEALISQSDLDRMNLAAATLSVRSALSRPFSRAAGLLGRSAVRSLGGLLLSYAIPAFGATRTRRLFRGVAIGIAVVRALRRLMNR